MQDRVCRQAGKKGANGALVLCKDGIKTRHYKAFCP